MLRRLVSAFPLPTSLVVAYGSSVFSQGRASDGDVNKLLDLLIAVDDPAAWHARNMARHADHYTLTWRALGPRAVARFQEWGGARCFFMPFVRVNGVPCKYGVVSTSSLLRDLEHWDTLYCSGRLHKPVKILSCTDARFPSALEANLRRALHVSLLQLSSQQPGVVSEQALYTHIAGLSYEGDVRMGVGESPSKVRNIVDNNLSAFQALYGPFMEELIAEKVVALAPPASLVVSDRAALERSVPFQWRSPEELARLVRHVSLVQTVKGLATAGQRVVQREREREKRERERATVSKSIK
jgi:translocator assembly and maintenance protein 41